MKYPKEKATAFYKITKCDWGQVNIHKGRVYNYWFIQPHEKPIKLKKGEIPFVLKEQDLSGLGNF